MIDSDDELVRFAALLVHTAADINGNCVFRDNEKDRVLGQIVEAREMLDDIEAYLRRDADG